MKTKKDQKQVSIEEYTQTYCQERRIRGRYAVYVSPEMHDNLKNVAGLFNGEFYTTTSSLADAILNRHFSEHNELLNNLLRERKPSFSQKPRMAEERGSDEPSGNPESYPDDDSEE